jgi:hypothetical protein
MNLQKIDYVLEKLGQKELKMEIYESLNTSEYHLEYLLIPKNYLFKEV